LTLRETQQMDGIVDAHHHIWRQADLPWLSGPPAPRIFGPYEALRRDYLVDEYRADVTPFGIEKAVYVQTNWLPDKSVDEVRWVQSVADQTGWPHAIVGSANLLNGDCRDVFRAQAKASPLMRGTRLQLHWHKDPALRFAPAPDLMNDSLFRRNLARIEDLGWLFELQVFPEQMRDAAKLAADFPGIPFVLVHAGMLERDTPDYCAAWLEGMQRMAAQPNVYVKLSGLGTFAHRVDAAFIAGVIRDCVALFGADRCMFGSNFPIEKLWTDFEGLWSAHGKALAELAEVDRLNILRNTATRVYQLW
jgi:predicted TIM-barrel fold metal-dependent hydrolase